MTTMRLTFLGATGTVTGSRYRVEHSGGNILVDCGLFQGYKQLRLRNWAPLPIPASSFAAVILTHAHLDHSGYLPLLVKQGFSGRVYCTEATYELCRILLPDSGRLQEEEADDANRYGYSKHRPALPLYSEADALAALRRFVPVPLGKPVEALPGLAARFFPAGHILGAAFAELHDGSTTIVFSGDVGRPHDPIMCAPAPIERADYLVVESTYGDRRHDPAEPRLKFGEIVRRTAARGGVVVMPAFAVGRAQALLYHLMMLRREGAIPSALPVYLNSPMAADVTELYLRFRTLHRLSSDECAAMCRGATIVNTPDESRRLNTMKWPMVIIAASGMATGGRVLHHLKAFAPDARNTILFSGYQSGGTRGAKMLQGDSSIRIHGEMVPVRAEVLALDNLSAHADYAEVVAWLAQSGISPRRTFITHGEPAAADAMRGHIADGLGWECTVPDYLETVELA
jgi:metallo-beta-lactamase family protein